jgi:hypothetical protein
VLRVGNHQETPVSIRPVEMRRNHRFKFARSVR